jgi:UDP-N-acetylenolpyruvoylglucosamine reductase
MLMNHIALSAVLKGHPAAREVIEQRMNAFSQKRWASQPAAPSAGCIFKNPDAMPAGKLIDELGLKGTRVGGAMVSMEHGNFIVTDGKAKAADVLKLMDIIQQRARTERGVELETEVQVVGED